MQGLSLLLFDGFLALVRRPQARMIPYKYRSGARSCMFNKKDRLRNADLCEIQQRRHKPEVSASS